MFYEPTGKAEVAPNCLQPAGRRLLRELHRLQRSPRKAVLGSKAGTAHMEEESVSLPGPVSHVFRESMRCCVATLKKSLPQGLSLLSELAGFSWLSCAFGRVLDCGSCDLA